ncbi:MAG: extracellular solute-binding protein [Oscillospiraceae bacterium]|nr:extracellular solute-binding protein [Oscillospiraceae bacterium]
MKKPVLFLLVLSLLILPGAAAPGDESAGEADLPSSDFRGVSYASLGDIPPEHVPEAEIVIDIEAFAEPERMPLLNEGQGGRPDALRLDEDGFVTYTVEVPQDGRYCLWMDYVTIPANQSNMEIAVEIDGELPFREAGVCIFRRMWRYAETERREDNKGNMLRPTSAEVEYFVGGAYFEDKEGLYADPFAFFLSKGTHTLTLRSIREPIGIAGLRLTPPPVTPTYAEVSAGYPSDAGASAEPVTVRATDAHLRSDQALLPATDRSNPNLDPVSLTNITYNIMGGDAWFLPGQSISWLLDVESDGYYTINFIYKQDAVVSLPVTRALKIDGEFPFEEARAMVFPYSSDWERLTVPAGDVEEALFWLEAGTHELSLNVTLGPTADVCRRVSEITTALSDLYTQIVMITGPNPDTMRDYRIDERLPNILDDFDRYAKQLDGIVLDIEQLGGGRNDALSVSIIASQLHDFVREPDSIPGRMMRFKDNVINLSIWVLMASEMPLALYSVTACAPGTAFEPIKPGFFESLWFSVRRFFASFTSMADMAGDVYEEDEEHVINVWGSYGKDYAETIKRLCDEIFTPQTGIKVNFSVLNRDEQMFFAISSKTGPDVCLNVLRGFPLDFGLRNAAVDLAELPGYEEFEKLFAPTMMEPLSFRGKTYGFPVQHVFPVMYVRTDIFADLGLSVPETWDDFNRVIKALAERNLQFSPGGDLLAFFLLQNGGSYFNEDLTACILDSPAGIEAQTRATDFFTLHGAPLVSSFFDRFRTGEMPIGIADNTLFTNLHYAALEIKDSWAMYPVPGTLRPDGSVDRTIVSGSGIGLTTSGFITNSRPERQDDAWEFVKWFMSVDAQTRYCREMEAIFSTIGRMYTATVPALLSQAWTKNAYETMTESLNNIREIPGVPGAYFLGRHITNASNEIILMGESPRTAMVKYTEMINQEITWKYEELGLNN